MNDSKLKRELQRWDNEYTDNNKLNKVRFMERCGRKVKTTICRSNPWQRNKCEREGCEMCEVRDEKQHGMCKGESITYKIDCEECGKEGKVVKYIGESSRSGWERKEDINKGYKMNRRIIHYGNTVQINMGGETRIWNEDNREA